jgi:competence protein ComEC
VLPFLYANGVRKLDRIIASHGDLDHIGGLKSVVSAMPAPLLAGPSVHSDVPNQSLCQRGQQWSYDDVRFEILYPGSVAVDHKDNNSSCVLRVSARGGSALVLGDIESAAERDLLAMASLIHQSNHGHAMQSDIVIVPHHGSKTSSSPDLVATLQARFAFIGVGADNRWGFPKPDVVERWRNAGASVYATDESGAIQITVGLDGLHVPQAYREQHRRFWRR